MKVICIKLPPTFTELKLNVGDITDTYLQKIGKDQRQFLFTIDSAGNHIPCDALDKQKYFITVQEFRERRLKELGI